MKMGNASSRNCEVCYVVILMVQIGDRDYDMALQNISLHLIKE